MDEVEMKEYTNTEEQLYDELLAVINKAGIALFIITIYLFFTSLYLLSRFNYDPIIIYTLLPAYVVLFGLTIYVWLFASYRR